MTNIIISSIELDEKRFNFEETHFFDHPDRELHHCRFEDYELLYQTNGKFPKEKICQEDDELLILFDGPIINYDEITSEEKEKDLFLLLKQWYLEDAQFVFNKIKGDYLLAIYDKTQKLWFVYTNPNNSKPLFYYYDAGKQFITIASNLKLLSTQIMKANISLAIDMVGVYTFLVFGYLLGQQTIVEGAKKMNPSSVLSFGKEGISEIHCQKYDNTPDNKLKMKDAIHQADFLFRKGLKQAFETDIRHGYQHIATLSGGLDSRMTVAIAHKEGYTDQLNFTFSEGNYADELIAKKIAKYFHHDFLFYSLDNGLFLYDFKSPVSIIPGQGTINYGAHSLKMFSLINWKRYGLIHTGVLGDAILSTYLTGKTHTAPSFPNRITNHKFYGKISSEVSSEKEKYQNEELFKFYNRGVNCIMLGYQMMLPFSDFTSPFLYDEFVDFILKIDPAYRYDNYFYLKWINTHHSDMTKFKWERYMIRPKPQNFKFPSKNILQLYNTKLKGFIQKKSNYRFQKSMNPFQRWHRENAGLEEHFSLLFKQRLPLIEMHNELLNDIQYSFEKNDIMEKIKVLSLLESINQIFGNNNLTI